MSPDSLGDLGVFLQMDMANNVGAVMRNGHQRSNQTSP